MTTDDYVDMYRHVVTRLRNDGVRNAVFVMTFMGFDRWATMVDDLYPGDDVVDWIGYDPYGRLVDTKFSDFINRPDGDTWPGFYSWATAKAPGTPIMLAEWGFDLAEHEESPELLSGAVDALENDFPEIDALVYWNGRGERVDARLGREVPLAERFADQYREFAADPYFDQPDLDALP
jgi:beta-mannanase